MNWRRVSDIVGVVVLLAWAGWWVLSVGADHLAWGGWTWVPAWPFLGVDFRYNYLAVRHWLGGGNPYRENFGDDRGLYTYPPLVLALFVWCGALGQRAATILWMSFIGGVVGATGWMVARRRGVSPWLGAAVVVVSTPVVFAMERGNCDVIVLVTLVLAAVAMRRKSGWGDFLAGVCLAAGMWTKIYPGMAVLGTLPLRRWRVFAWAVAAGLFIGLAPFSATRDFFHDEPYRSKFIASAVKLENDPERADSGTVYYPPLEEFSHSLPIYWRTFWKGFPGIARVPGVIGVAAVLGPLAVWLGWRVWRSSGREAVVWAFLTWMTLLGTFWMPVSYDYNLIYLPILMLAVFAWRDGVIAVLLLAPVLSYLQPLRSPVLAYLPPLRAPIGMDLILLFKLMALAGLAICIAHRTDEAGGLRKCPTS